MTELNFGEEKNGVHSVHVMYWTGRQWYSNHDTWREGRPPNEEAVMEAAADVVAEIFEYMREGRKGEKMTVEELKDRKDQLEKELNDSVQEFLDETGIKPKIHVRINGKEQADFVQVMPLQI